MHNKALCFYFIMRLFKWRFIMRKIIQSITLSLMSGLLFASIPASISVANRCPWFAKRTYTIHNFTDSDYCNELYAEFSDLIGEEIITYYFTDKNQMIRNYIDSIDWVEFKGDDSYHDREKRGYIWISNGEFSLKMYEGYSYCCVDWVDDNRVYYSQIKYHTEDQRFDYIKEVITNGGKIKW